VRIQEPKDFLSLLAGDEKSKLGEGSASVKVNGVNINLNDVIELTTPRLMYLWRGQ
jgi:hypothetical protein